MEETSSTCTKCGTEKPITEFYPDVRYADKPRAWCCECVLAVNRERYYARNAENPRLEWAKSAARAAQRRAKRARVPCEIDHELLLSMAPSHCPVLGVELTYKGSKSNKRSLRNSASVDRIIPELGYVHGNIIVISRRANMIKNDASPEELRNVADFFAALIPPNHAP